MWFSKSKKIAELEKSIASLRELVNIESKLRDGDFHYLHEKFLRLKELPSLPQSVDDEIKTLQRLNLELINENRQLKEKHDLLDKENNVLIQELEDQNIDHKNEISALKADSADLINGKMIQISTLENTCRELKAQHSVALAKVESDKQLALAKLQQEFQEKSYEQFLSICTAATARNNKEVKDLFEALLNKIKALQAGNKQEQAIGDSNYKVI